MNPHDHKNLMFILQANQETFDAWADQASTDDLTYALELIAQHRRELLDQEAEIFDEITDFTEALEVINRVKKGVAR